MDTLLNQQLWHPAGVRSPNWPIGATRLIQHRVKIPEDCLKADDQTCQEKFGSKSSDKQNELMECLKSTFDYRCNPPFVPEKTEQGPIPVAAEDELDVIDDTVYREFTPLDPEKCAVNDEKTKC